jgi:hypothetical protein
VSRLGQCAAPRSAGARERKKRSAAAREGAIVFAMRAFNRLLLAAVAMSVTNSPALGDGALTIHVANDSTDSLLVSLYDRNLRRRQKVLAGEMINGDASISITISADSSGLGHVYWTAMTVDSDMRRCGHGDRRHVNGDSTIHVNADTRCSH